MVTMPPYIFDYQSYPLIPEADRWIFNKLQLAERLGYECGPIGTVAPFGDYCVRPIYSMLGEATGGFYKITIDAIKPHINEPHGYFWCEWFDGDHMWTQYINDVPAHASRNRVDPTTNVLSSVSFDLVNDAIVMPDFLKGISRYMLIEAIGDNIIECSPRGMTLNARQELIDDYATIDPTYSGQDVVNFRGNADGELLATTLGEQMQNPEIVGFRWGNVHNRRPFPDGG